MSSQTRSALASAIGWTIVALVAFWLFGMLLGWIGFLLRSFLWIVVIAALVGVYLFLKGPPDT